jgi:hypothetical protein
MWGRFAFGRRTLRWRAIKLRLWNDGERGCGRGTAQHRGWQVGGPREAGRDGKGEERGMAEH